jgi:hypothetical protein
MFTGTRFVALVPLLVPSYVLALLVETVNSRVTESICLFPLPKELLPTNYKQFQESKLAFNKILKAKTPKETKTRKWQVHVD